MARPEVVLKDKAHLMLTFINFKRRNKPDSRFRKIIKARKKKCQAQQ